MASNQPGCLTQIVVTLAAAFVAVAGIELWVDRYAWPVDPGWYRLEVADGEVTFTCQNFEPVRFSVKPEKRRIIVLGGSTTFGYPERRVGTEPAREVGGFVGALQRAAPDVEFVDLGVNGGNSVDTVRIWRRAVDWGADTVVVYDGHNEFMDIAPGVIAPLWRFALYRQLAVLLPKTTVSPGWVGPPSYGSEANRQAVVDRFRRNLETIVDLAEDHGIKVVMVTQIANLAGFDPSWSTSGEPPGDADRAWARGSQRLGSLRGPIHRSSLLEALDEDGMPFRASTAIDDVIREVAQQRGATLVEGAPGWTTFEGEDPSGLDAADPSAFYDWVHLQPAAAAELAGAIGGALGLPAAPTLSAFSPADTLAIDTRVAAGWLQWSCVRQHDPAFRLQNAAEWANRALIVAPGDPEATALLALATHQPVVADERLRIKLSHIHPCIAAQLK